MEIWGRMRSDQECIGTPIRAPERSEMIRGATPLEVLSREPVRSQCSPGSREGSTRQKSVRKRQEGRQNGWGKSWSLRISAFRPVSAYVIPMGAMSGARTEAMGLGEIVSSSLPIKE